MEVLELVQSLKSGNQKSLEELMIQFNGLLYRVLSRMVSSKIEIEELIQETWVKAYFKLDSLKDPELFKAWICRIAYNLGIDHLRKKKLKLFSKEEEEMLWLDEKKDIEMNDVQKILWKNLKTLKEKYKMPLILYYFENFSYEEVAQIMNHKLNTIKSLIRRAKEQLKIKLESEGVNLWNL